MQWIHDFQLFLFDFDGLLVNTEHLHYQAYVTVLAARGIDLGWSFYRFCECAHLNANALKEAMWAERPELEAIWHTVYAEKTQAYIDLLGAGKVDMMPGAGKLLEALDQAKIRRCVVTHSLRSYVEAIRSQTKELQSIPHWITREDYAQPKPNPECYLRAIQLHGKTGDRILGFEDSIRGLQALSQTPALPVLVCAAHHPLLEMASERAVHFESLEDISSDKLV